METHSPAIFPNGAFAAAYFAHANNAASGPAVPSSSSQNNEDIDGCDVEAEVLTSDEELPVAEGGVA